MWSAPWSRGARQRVAQWLGEPRAGVALLLLGTAFVTLLVLAIDRLIVSLPNPGVLYLPLIAMLAYHWSWRLGALAGLLQLALVYALFLMPVGLAKAVDARGAAQLVTLAAVNVFTLLLVQLAHAQRDTAARQAGRSQALNVVGGALTSELDEARLLRLIAQTARDLTGADFAAFTLRPLDAHGVPVVPAEGNLFHLAAVVGVTPEQEALFRRVPLGGEGLLAPIFRNGVPVLVADALGMVHSTHPPHPGVPDQSARTRTGQASGSARHLATGEITRNAQARQAAQEPAAVQERHTADGHESPAPRVSRRDAARDAATAYAQGHIAARDLHAVGSPRGHPVVRSFLGVPLLDREGQVRGGLLLGHTEPGRFSTEDEELLVGLAAQASVALENARLYRAAQTQAQELDAIFDSISDAVMLVDGGGRVIRENRAAGALRAEGDAARAAVERVTRASAGASAAEATQTTTTDTPGADRAAGAAKRAEPVEETGEAAAGSETHTEVVLADVAGEERQYAVTSAPLREPAPSAPARHAPLPSQTPTETPGAVVVWHDLTEARRLLSERQARAEADTRRALLQLVIDEMPGGIYLVRGPQARMVLANQAAREVWGADWAEGQPMMEFLAQRGVGILAPEGRPLAEDELATVRAVRTGTAVRHHQEIIRRPDGTSLPVLLNAVALDTGVIPFVSPGGTQDKRETKASRQVAEQERAALVVLQDVTALKDAERVKDEFITIAAHELKTPMAAVKGYTDMLRRRSIGADAGGAGGAPGGDEQAAEATASAALAAWQLDALETIDQATGRLVELTDDLLDVARLQAGRVELHLEPHDLIALARRVAKRLQFSTERHTISVEADEEYIVARLDVRRVEQVVGNLLNNAIKYSPEGGPIKVTVREDSARGEAVLTVRDRGMGIPAAEQRHLFARFARAENARAAGIGGTGLGLYLSRELIERHSGRIWFESAGVGAGSAFSIALPLAGDDPDEGNQL